MAYWIRLFAVAAVAAACVAHAGENKKGSKPIATKTWHEKFEWDADDYFDAAETVALCRAIEANDIHQIRQLVNGGADVNARGKGNMTPLMWAFPDNQLRRFRTLLELGADPNVIVESDFNTRGSGILPGDSVTYLACKTAFPGYFESVFEYGGDPDFRHRKSHDTPLLAVIKGQAPSKAAKIRRLIELGADVNANRDDAYTGKSTPVMAAVSYFGQYELANILLASGADYTHVQSNGLKLVHLAVLEERRLPKMPKKQLAEYEKLIKWLDQHGESLHEAREQIEAMRKNRRKKV